MLLCRQTNKKFCTRKTNGTAWLNRVVVFFLFICSKRDAAKRAVYVTYVTCCVCTMCAWYTRTYSFQRSVQPFVLSCSTYSNHGCMLCNDCKKKKNQKNKQNFELDFNGLTAWLKGVVFYLFIYLLRTRSNALCIY